MNKKRKSKKKTSAALAVLHPDAAGLYIGAIEKSVAVPGDNDPFPRLPVSHRSRPAPLATAEGLSSEARGNGPLFICAAICTGFWESI